MFVRNSNSNKKKVERKCRSACSHRKAENVVIACYIYYSDDLT